MLARPPAEGLSVVQEFDPPHPLAEPVVFAAKALAERMHDGLAARGLTCVRVRVQATWADGRESRRLWRHDGLLSAAGVADRWSGLAGSAFDVPFGEGYDLILLTNFLHHFDAPTCEGLLRKVRAALAPGGLVVTLEFIPNEDGVTPPFAALFSMTMLTSTPKGRAYRFSELEAMHRAVGFTDCALIELPPTPQRLVVARKP